ncbi:MAG: bifunctional N(6)-L-threonylcarbamoyladenine synthase/serine/threonine protein kinase [Euryarchaeota archaeon]|nr:bifunctional N(6)-L-threonylcarbamoyladenine synthase/serine/threonine protein kinase [Euryarchaeota archaeon]
MRVLGIEGTAWAASAALYDDAADDVFIESDPYQPDSGGIHPREAAEHMGEAIPQVVSTVLSHAAETATTDAGGDSDVVDHSGNPYGIDAVAFSRGPGLGPCLRTVGTAARAAAQRLGVPLVGVNHMVAHLEIGRHQSGFDSPVCLNASGANAHLLGFHNGRYRVLGETMDTGVGNALDKFTRHIGWNHPGGPKVEEAAKDGEFIDFPYVVKGMDFSFSGIMSAAKQAADDGEEIEDICFSLQEHVFGMLTEVAERALSLTGTDELVLGGGVGQNRRLQEMLETMCEARGASFHAPDPRLLRDNAGMIAVLGAKQFAAGDTLTIAESTVDPNFRPDQVPVTWRADEPSVARGLAAANAATATQRGAEAVVEELDPADEGLSLPGRCVRKRRVPKTYRHPELDETLRAERTTAEARLTSQARRAGVPTPLVWDVDTEDSTIWFEHVGEADLAAELAVEPVRAVGKHLATIHEAGFVHGDPTTRNVRIGDRTWLIDFGLGFYTGHVEDHAMDLHVFRQSLDATADDPEPLTRAVLAGYREVGSEAVLDRLATIEDRGRYQ